MGQPERLGDDILELLRRHHLTYHGCDERLDPRHRGLFEQPERVERSWRKVERLDAVEEVAREPFDVDVLVDRRHDLSDEVVLYLRVGHEGREWQRTPRCR